MQTGYTGHITPAEWRWVILVAVTLVTIAFLPFLWVLVIDVSASGWQFMGALHGFANGATSLARVQQGTQGELLIHLLHSPEPHAGLFVDGVYALLGQLASLIQIEPIAIFHAARVGASLFMYLALYQLAANIWMRVRTRRIFFVFVSLSSGLGWLMTPLLDSAVYLDVGVPYMSPFFASLVNVHFPLTIALLAMLATNMIIMFRPGNAIVPRVDNGTILIFLVALLVALIFPVALVPVFIAVVFSIALDAWQRKAINAIYMRWLMWIVVPAIPLFVYYAFLIDVHPVASRAWGQIIDSAPPPVLVLLLSLGLPFVLAAPGLIRGVVRLEQDGDRFMIAWIFGMISLVYLPVSLGTLPLVGIMLPIGYFATRSIEDNWFNFVNRRWRLRVMVAMLPIIAMTNVFVLLLPLRPLSSDELNGSIGIVLEQDYAAAFDWIERFADEDDVVLASANTSLWLPAWTGVRVVYGHPKETVQAATKRDAVDGWYRGTHDCDSLLNGDLHIEAMPYTVTYVIYGPQEAAMGDLACRDRLTLDRQFGSVRVFEVRSDT